MRRALPGVEAAGAAHGALQGSVFRSAELRRFEPVWLPPAAQPRTVPDEAQRVLGWTRQTHVPGAYDYAPVAQEEPPVR